MTLDRSHMRKIPIHSGFYSPARKSQPLWRIRSDDPTKFTELPERSRFPRLAPLPPLAGRLVDGSDPWGRGRF